MTPKQEAAMRLALEALENASDIMDSWAQKRQDDAIAALRSALAEPDEFVEDETIYCSICGEEDGGTTCGMPDCGLRCGVEPVQEPVACMDMLRRARNLLSHPPIWSSENAASRHRLSEEIDAFITAPPQRKPLTEEEIKACEKQAMVNGALPFEQRVIFARAIEAMHEIR